MGDFQAAIRSYVLALKLNPDNQDTHLNLAYVFKDQEEFILSVRHFEEVVRINPENIEAMFECV